jgi:hypothetical protein
MSLCMVRTGVVALVAKGSREPRRLIATYHQWQATNDAVRANQARQIDDVIALLPRLQHGLDVNVRFTR